jgi:hypothetical protein
MSAHDHLEQQLLESVARRGSANRAATRRASPRSPARLAAVLMAVSIAVMGQPEAPGSASPGGS